MKSRERNNEGSNTEWGEYGGYYAKKKPAIFTIRSGFGFILR